MKYAVVVSKKDPAGMNIKEQLLLKYKFKLNADNNYVLNDIGLFEIEEESIYADDVEKIAWADFIVFATKHKSSAGKNSLSVHIPGNWSEAKLGGKDRRLCVAPASLMKALFAELNKKALKLKDYAVTLEATHHGPLISKPCVFIEIGSSLKQWQDPDAGRVIADTIMAVLRREIPECETVIGIGGTHYPENFNRIMLETKYAIGHICPKYALNSLNEYMLKQAVDKVYEKVSFAVLDWKSLGQSKARIVKLLDDIGLRFKKSKDVLKENNA